VPKSIFAFTSASRSITLMGLITQPSRSPGARSLTNCRDKSPTQHLAPWLREIVAALGHPSQALHTDHPQRWADATTRKSGVGVTELVEHGQLKMATIGARYALWDVKEAVRRRCQGGTGRFCYRLAHVPEFRVQYRKARLPIFLAHLMMDTEPRRA